MKLKLPLLLLSAAALALSASAASPWSVRVGATYLSTVDKSTNSAVPVKTNDKLIPELDITYAFNSHWAAELVLSVPQQHDVKSGGVKLGTFKHLPPTLLAKYTINPEDSLRFYVGAGVNFTLIFDDDLGAIKLDNYSVGPAAQVGFDYVINERWAINADVKRAVIRSDVKAGGVKLTEARLDPWLYSLGLRYSF